MVNLWAASVSDEQKQVRRTYLLVQVWPMVQDREHKRSASETQPEDAGEGSPQVVFGLALEDLA
jgi:hypothetical protein